MSGQARGLPIIASHPHYPRTGLLRNGLHRKGKANNHIVQYVSHKKAIQNVFHE